jgi:hypothetical protein
MAELSELGGTTRVGARSGGSVRPTARHWDRWMIVTRCLLIGPYEFKFDH